MTKYWGPLGWATLHTVSALYPAEPSSAEMELAYRWLDTFAACITCPSCQGHFTKMLSTYRNSHPDMLASRRNFVLFVLRAHNTVNRRIGNKVYSLEECFTTLESLFDNGSALTKRREYLRYLQKDWGRQTTMTGISMLMKIRELSLAEGDYWSRKQLNWLAVRSDIDPATDVTSPVIPVPGSSLRSADSSVVQRIAQPQRFKIRGMSLASSMLISR